ncbi:low molecular weight phosphatase family protein, partial [Amylibacter sp.]|nr:low molecular weight phosphatase family protein [Amylibacter sp.]
ELSRHRTRSFDDLMEWGDDLDSYDLIVALSPAAQRRALEYTRFYSLEVEYWQTMDPSGFGDSREAKLNQYRLVRDQITQKIKERFLPK